jgi:hypothetical protein
VGLVKIAALTAPTDRGSHTERLFMQKHAMTRITVRKLAFLILPAVLVLAMPTVASATAGSRISSAAGARPAPVDAALAAAHPTAVAAATRNFIVNASAIVLGVIHVRDGSYRHGTYDSILPAEKSTDVYLGWPGAAGWYTGPGYCTAQWRSDNGGPWSRQVPDLGSGQHFIGAHTSYIVKAYPC